MAKETVRYPDALVARVESVVAEAEAFESKSEYYRFASDFLLSVLDPEHDPTVLGYGDILRELESTTDGRLDMEGRGTEASTGPFLDAYIQVRRHLLYDDVEAARTVVTERYDATDREALLLDEIIGRERRSATVDRDSAWQPDTAARDRVRQPDTAARKSEEERAESGGDGSHEEPAATGGTAADGEAVEFGEEPARRRAEATRETDGGTDTVDVEDA
jgi:hypothetical protein